MNKFKKTFLFLASGILALSLAACGQDEESSYSQIPFSSAEQSVSSENTPESDILSSVSSESSSSETASNTSKTKAGTVPESSRANSSYFDDVVFVGDSVSLKLEYYESAVDKLGSAQFLTAGSLGSGNALQDISDESVHPTYNGEKMLLKDSVPLTGAKKLYIMLGMNDLAVYGVDGTISNYITLLQSIESTTPGLTVFVQSMTPLTSTSEILGDDLNNDNVRIYNQKMSEVCKEHGWYFLDVASVMYDDEGNLIRDYCSDPDDMGVHFTEIGCEAWIEYLYTHIPV